MTTPNKTAVSSGELKQNNMKKQRKLLDEWNQKIIANYVLHENGEVRDKHDIVTLGVLNCDIWYLDEIIKKALYSKKV